ncbi:unnamed protein product [Hapterophycus canaliculatus]
MPCSPDDLRLRSALADSGGLECVKTTLLAHGDVRLQCKAANALASLCMSEDVAKGFSAAPNSSAVIDRLGDMLRSRSQWAQADAAGCLGWLVNSLAGGPVLHELTPLMTQLMVKHTTHDDEVFIREEKQRVQQAARDRNHKRKGGGGGSGGGGGGRKDDQARERMDNIRVYTLIFLLKASHADPRTMLAMVEAGAIPALLKHLASSARGAHFLQGQQQRDPAGNAAQLGEASGHRKHPLREVVDQGGVGQTPHSLLLAVRLLYTFSLDPCARSCLLEAKSLPPLIRLRRQLQLAATFTAVKQKPTSEGPDGVLTASSRGKGVSVLETRAIMGNRTAQPKGIGAAGGDRSSAVVAVDESNSQPPLEVMVGLIVDQMVGKESSNSPVRKNDL